MCHGDLPGLLEGVEDGIASEPMDVENR